MLACCLVIFAIAVVFAASRREPATEISSDGRKLLVNTSDDTRKVTAEAPGAESYHLKNALKMPEFW